MADRLCQLATDLADAYIDWREQEKAYHRARRKVYGTFEATKAHEGVKEVLRHAANSARARLDQCEANYKEATEVDRD